MSENLKKISLISELQCIAIVLVVIGHSFPMQGDGRPFIANFFHRFIYSFHMPLFMYISGFLFMYTNRERIISYRSFILKKAKRLLLPYFFLGSLGFLIKVLLSKYAIRPVTMSMGDFLTSIFYPNQNAILFFWFIFTLFIIFLIAPFLKRIIELNILASMIVLLTCLFLNFYRPINIGFLGISRVEVFLLYFVLGCLTGQRLIDFVIKYGNLFLFAILAIIHSCYTYYSLSATNVFLSYFPILTGFLMTFTLAKILLKIDVFRYIKGFSYQIYLLSWFAQSAIMVLSKLFKMDYFILSISLTLSGIVLPVIVSELCKRKFRKLNVLIGM